MSTARRTKVVCTIGPACHAPETIEALLRAGMNVARLNMSHGSHDYHRDNIARLRAAADRLGANLALLMDLQGPKIRTGPLENGGFVDLRNGGEFTLTTAAVPGTAACVSTTYDNLPNDVKPGDRILLADGVLELRVRRVEAPRVVCEVVRGGALGQHKGINLPGVHIDEPCLTGKDLDDLAFGLELGVDLVALSFVRTPNDIAVLRGHLARLGGAAGIVAKIERPEALDCFDDIVRCSDAIMVARGDLGVEIDFEEVPVVQKRLIQTCNGYGVPVITATQMLESMIGHPRPTRAEVADVANAVYDGTDAVMLSGETAAGQYPAEACAAMTAIVQRADHELTAKPRPERWVRLRTAELLQRAANLGGRNFYADAIGQAACRMAEALDIRRIVCFTTSGYTAAAIARYRPAARITAITNSPATQRRCALLWGVETLLAEDFGQIDHVVARVEALLLEHGLVANGETILIVAGTPLRVGGRTNLLKLHTAGEEH